MKNKAANFSILLLLCLLASGCQTYKSKSKDMGAQWRQGNVAEAAKQFGAKAAKEVNTKDTVVWRLEQAAALRANGQLEESNTAFNVAEEQIDKYDEKAKVSVSTEVGAMFSNQANLPYQGRDYDRVMLNAYKALNYLQLHDPEKARTELLRAYQRQQDAVENNKKQIAKLEEEAKKADEKARDNAEKAKADPKFSKALTQHYGEIDSLKPYADYVNPFVVYLDALYFMTNPAGNTDLERANKSLERMAGFSVENKFIQEDRKAIQSLLAGGSLEPTTYVIFETGCAPVRDQIRIDIPLFFIGKGNVPYAGAAFPILKVQDGFLPTLTLAWGDKQETTTVLADMDTVVGQSFKNELPTIITKTLLSTGIKAAAAYGINKAVSDQNAIAGIFSKIVTGIGEAMMNIADTRTWTTLPKQIQFARLPRAADGKLTLTGPGGLPKNEIILEEGIVNLVFVKSVSATSPLLVSQIKLK